MYLLVVILAIMFLLDIVVLVSGDSEVTRWDSVNDSLYIQPLLPVRIDGIDYVFGGIP